MAISISASTGGLVYMTFQDDGSDAPGNWKEVAMPCSSGALIARPAVLSRTEGDIDIFTVTAEGRVLTISYSSSSDKWGDWKELGGRGTSEHEVSATSWGPDRMDIFVTTGSGGDYIEAGHVLHKSWTIASGWSLDWESLDGIDTPSPARAVSYLTTSGDGVIDIVITEFQKYSSENYGGSPYHRLYSNGAWGDWTMMLASHEGYEFYDAQSIFLGDTTGLDGKPVAHLVSRGTWDCIGYTSFNGTDWDFWTSLWCAPAVGRTVENPYPTAGMALFAVKGEAPGTGHVLARNLEGEMMRLKIDGVVDETVDWRSASWEVLGRGSS